MRGTVRRVIVSFLRPVAIKARMDVLAGDESFSLFCRRIVSPALRAIADHWLAARGDKRLPSWSDLSPSAIAPHFTKIWAFKYDRGNDEFYARLAGNRIMVGFGRSFRGTPLKDLHPADIYEKCHANQKRLVTEPAVYRGTGKLFKAGGQIVSGERIALPLASDGCHGDGTLGASEYDYKVLGPLKVELIHDGEEWYPL
jgi:hypothetical protein